MCGLLKVYLCIYVSTYFCNALDWTQGLAYDLVKSLHDTEVQCNMECVTENYLRGNGNLNLFPTLSGYLNF